MLVHECIECKSLSINRIAADDDSDSIMDVFNESLLNGYQIHARSEANGIVLLNAEDIEIVHIQLFGQITEIPANLL